MPISTSEDNTTPVAIGFPAARNNGRYQYFWLYRVKFTLPTTTLATKADNITFSTPTVDGTILRRNKPDATDKHPWKTKVTKGAAGVKPETINAWYQAVNEPATDAEKGVRI